MALPPFSTDLRASPTLAMNEKMNDLQQAGRDIFRFGFGQSPFPVPEVLVRSLQAFADKKEYLPVQGLLGLREAIAAFYSSRLDTRISPEQVVIGPGTKELIWSAILSFPGEILLPSPSWVSYAPQAFMAKKKVTWVHTHIDNNWIMNGADFETACQATGGPKLLILNYPNNPTGTIPSEQQMLEIVDVARRNDVVIIHDNIYGLLDHSGQDSAFSRVYPDSTILSDGLSKWCGAGGWRLGFHIYPEALRPLQSAVLNMASETYSCVAAPIQYAARAAFNWNQPLKDYVDNCRKILGALATYSYQNLSGSRLYVRPSTGGFYFFPIFNAYRAALKAREIHTSTTLCEHILEETGVALLPGSVFGRPEQELSARLAYVDFDGAKALHHVANDDTAISNTDAFVSEYCPRVPLGLSKLTTWLDKL